jgi:hypothetical protein
MDKKTNKERFEDAYDEALGETAQFLEEAYIDYRFFVGDQWTGEEKAYLKKFNRDPVVFNYIRRYIKRVGGHQRKNRLATTIEATENQDQLVAEIYDDVSKWVHKRSGAYKKLSEAFEKGSLVPGWNLLHPYMDFSRDPINGEVQIARRAYNTFLLAPDFSELDLSDCRYIITADYMNKDEAKGLLPKKASAIDDLSGGKMSNRFNFIGTDHLENEDTVCYVEFWERINKKRYMLIDNTTGGTQKWRGSKADLDRHVDQFPWMEYIVFYEPTVQLTVFIQDEEMYHGEDPYGSKERGIEFGEYPHVLVPGYFEPEMNSFEWKLQGLVRTLKWAQREENKRKSQMFTILDSAPYGGYMVKNGAVVNHDDLYQTGPGVVITLDEASQMSDVQELRQRDIPQSTMVLSEQLKQDLVELGGGSEEFMGTADLGNSQISGTLAKMRSSNSVESLQDLFDNLNDSQQYLGGKIVKLIRINFTPSHIKRITGKEIPENFYQEDVEKFDLNVSEGMLTDNNRNLAYVQALQARDRGIPIPDRFIIANMPIANKSELMEAYEAEAKQAQEQQIKVDEMAEMQKRLANAETIHKLSLAEQQRKRAVADEALALERVSESKYNQAQAIDKRMDSILKQIQAMGEIQDMDLERMQSAARFILEMYENKRREEVQSHQASRQEIERDEMQNLIEMNVTDEMSAKASKPQEQVME